ncbi:MAG: FKBP-type peptidyl-prolyl cis-trans isomerase [Planctomycetes bacterium]|nr:FKBP-type peptidyl-prolyl cis-trans isomerase [Planctomycetota bacterium]
MRFAISTPSIVLGSALVGALAACGRNEHEPTAEELRAEVAAAHFTPYVEERAAGLRVEVLAPGEGPAITASSRVTLHYNAYVPGIEKPFDTTRESGIPLELDLSGGSGPRPLAGLALGLVGLKRGSKAKLTIGAPLGFGDTGNPGGGVPAGSDVVYAVEILEVRG